MSDEKATLKRYLQQEREALLWKLEGLSERQIRWPMTPTGTNLLGLVKHCACIGLGYFGDTFGRPSSERTPFDEPDAGPNDDLYATADESRDDIIAFARRAWAHADATIDALDLDAEGHVPWWPEDRNPVTLHRILVHVIADLARHAGHADILRELTDGSAGLRAANTNLPEEDAAWWADYVADLKQIAEQT